MQKQDSEQLASFRSVQYLRGIAAVAVVYFHTKVYLGEYAWPVGRQFGYGGVDLFFAISGFIMLVTTSAKKESPLSFYAKRIVRVVPLYWGATLASLVLFFVIPSAFIKQTTTFEHIVLSMLFVPHQSPSELGAAPFFKIGWTLNFEMFFYLVFGLTLLMNRIWLRFVAIAMFFGGMVLFGVFVEPVGAALGYYTSPFVLEFVMGAFVGYLACNGIVGRIPGILASVGTCLALGCVLYLGGAQGDGLARAAIYGVPAACLVAFAVSAEQRGRILKSGLLERLGDASYSIYLAHPFVLTGFKFAAKALDLPVQNPIFGAAGIILSVTAAVVFGYMIYCWVERPLLEVTRRLLLKRKEPASSVLALR